MFIRIVLVLLVLSCGVCLAQAEWTKVMTDSEAGGYTLYFETTSLRIDNKMVKMWLLYDFKTDQKDEKDVSYLSLRFQREYNCKQERARTVAQSLFDGNMARGKEISSDSIERPWEPVAPGSIGETLWFMACGRFISMPRGSQRSDTRR